MSTHRIAIIGSGMAGLVAAHALDRAHHQVTLFDTHATTGLSAHSHPFAGGTIDAPLRVMNPQLWRHTIALAQSLGIELYRIRTDMACSWVDAEQMGATWFRSQRRQPFPFPIPSHWHHARVLPVLAWGVYRLRQHLRQLPAYDNSISLQQWLALHPMPQLFWDGCVVPVLLTVCTCDVPTLLQWPAKPLLEFVQLLLQDAGLYRLHGGTQQFAHALQQRIAHRACVQIEAVWQAQEQAYLRTADGQTHDFDHIIVATASQQTGFLDRVQYQRERHCLQQLPHTSGRLVSHTDASCMPRWRRDWAPLHYSMSPDFQRHSFSVWLNPIEESLRSEAAVFQTWQPMLPIAKSSICHETTLSRAVCTPASLQVVQQLAQLQAQSATSRRVWLCGSWWCEGLPILESAVTSAQTVTSWLLPQLVGETRS